MSNIKSPAASDNCLILTLDYFDSPKFRVELKGSSSRTDVISVFPFNKMSNLYIVFGVKSWPFYTENGFMLRNPFLEAVKSTKNSAPDKYCYSGYDISFDVRGTVSLVSGGGFGRKVVIFGVDMSASLHVGNRIRDILILGKGPNQGLGDTTLTVEGT